MVAHRLKMLRDKSVACANLNPLAWSEGSRILFSSLQKGGAIGGPGYVLGYAEVQIFAIWIQAERVQRRFAALCALAHNGIVEGVAMTIVSVDIVYASYGQEHIDQTAA